MFLEQFTEREHDILGLMLEGMSNREIAEHLTVSVETVRWYSKQIYSKLDVHSRKEAIHKARELGFDTQTEIMIAPQHNLPSMLTTFVGREQEISDLLRLITETEAKLITILAAGGMGKTRLALAVAHRLNHVFFPDGLYFVPLQALSSSDHLVSTIGNYSKYQFQPDSRSAKQQVLDYLQEKQLLLLMDNFEHLLGAASFISELLQAAPRVKILVTSRERLNIYGETTFTISGLSYSENATEYNDALKLFEQNARHLRPDWQISEQDLSAIQQICAQVEGMPLGIELAAAWMDVLSPQEIAHEISTSIQILESSLQDVPERHRSMNAMLETTWQRLDEKLQIVFMKLAVFRDGFTREAAQSVVGMTLQTLQSLIDKALIRRDGNGRFCIHELLRQFAEQRLQVHNLANNVRSAHLQFYVNFVMESEVDIKGRRQLAGLKNVDVEFENIRTAWQYAVAQRHDDSLRQMLEGLKLYCDMRNLYAERHEFFTQTRQQLFPYPGNISHPLWCRMMVRYAGFLGHRDDVRPEFEQCLEQARYSQDVAEIAYCLFALGDANVSLRDFPQALALFAESVEVYRQLDDKFYLCQILNRLATIKVFSSQLENALEYAQQSIQFGHESGNKIGTGWALHTLAILSLSSGQFHDGIGHFQEAQSIWIASGNQEGLATTLFNIGWFNMYVEYDLDHARLMCNQGLKIATNINNSIRVGGALAALSAINSLEDNYQIGMKLSRQAEPMVEPSIPTQITNYMAMAMAACGLEDYTLARQSMKRSLTLATQSSGIFAALDNLVVAAMIHAHHERFPLAVELLSLYLTHPQSPKMEKWPMVMRLRVDLEKELGTDAYNVAWERGKSLDPQTVVQGLLG